MAHVVEFSSASLPACRWVFPAFIMLQDSGNYHWCCFYVARNSGADKEARGGKEMNS